MAKATILPLGLEFEVSEGESIMGAAQREGYYWPTTCGGEGRCTTCACTVVSGSEYLSPRGRSEERVLADERGPAILEQPVRLACQAQVSGGDVVVEKPGVRRPFELRASGIGESKE
jgi:2Fe-2S ferredoxin